jgi:hypothetical protein
MMAEQHANHLIGRTALELGTNFDGAVLSLGGGGKQHQLRVGEFHRDSPFGYDGVSRRHHRSPAVAIKPAGRNPEKAKGALQARSVRTGMPVLSG